MSDNTKVYGTGTIKEVLEAGFKIVSKIEAAKADDGKIDFWEAVGVTAGSAADVYNIIKNGQQIKNEYNDLDTEEREEIVIWFSEKFELSNDNAEAIIEAIFAWIVKTDETIKTIIAYL